MARLFVWTCAALLFAGSSLRAAEICDATQQRAGGPPQAQGDKHPDQPPAGRDGHRPRWWSDPKSRTELGITDQQSALVEQIFQKNIQTLRDTRTKLEKLEEELTRLTNENTADESVVIAKIEAVENTRADGNKRRTLMIYQMLRVLRPDQRVKVRAMFEQPRDPQRRGPGLR